MTDETHCKLCGWSDDQHHDDAATMRLLEAIAKRDHVCSISITTHQGQWWVLIENYGSKPRFEGIGDSLGLAIVRAAAAVTEKST